MSEHQPWTEVHQNLLCDIADVHSGDIHEGMAIVRIAVDALRATADRRVADMREAAAQAVEQEAVEVDPDNHDPTDVSYNLALRHAADAIRALPDAPEPQGWRDIATVPSDNDDLCILLWDTQQAQPVRAICLGPYVKRYTHWMHDPLASLPPPPSARTAPDDAGEVEHG